MSAPLTNTDGLKPGDVVQYALELTKQGQPFWFTRFAAVVSIESTKRLTVLTLVLHPDPKFEPRRMHLGTTGVVVTFLPEEQWPQGVVAMRMKHIHTGLLKLGDV